MKSHYRYLAVAGIAALVSVGPTASVVPAHALTLLSTPSTAVCSILSPETVTPGVSLSPQTFAYDSGGETAQLTCLGAFKGFAVTGPGRYSEKGTLTGTCVQAVQGSGPGHFSLTIPTSGGSVHVEGTTPRRRWETWGPRKVPPSRQPSRSSRRQGPASPRSCRC